ncbi:MAG: COG4280 domain-containing protein [Dehalococcoidia bacterium]
MNSVLIFSGAFLASTVEMVEALTIVLAAGVTRGWRAPLIGVMAGLLALGAVVAVAGPSLVNWVPLDGLRIVIGSLLLVFGLQWLRKAILRASGRKALHDEAAIYQEEVAELEAEPLPEGFDWTAFTVSFKGVFLEGLEVAFIVLTFGANHGSYGLTVAGATVGLVLVVGTGLVVHRPLARVPENHIKFAVGVMLTAFGTFWAGEGIGIEWTLEDGMLVGLIALYIAVAFGLVAIFKRRPSKRIVRPEPATS